MANVRSANTWYVDTTYSTIAESLVVKGIRVLGVVVTATAANGTIVLKDEVTAAPIKLDLRVPTSGETRHFDFSNTPIRFPNGIRPVLTDAVVTVILEESNSNG